VTGAIYLNGWYGPYFGQGPESSPLARITADAPPFLVAHGDRDPLVPVTDARNFVDQLRRTSTAPVVYAELRGGNHAFDLYHSFRFEALIDAIDAYTAQVR
jgi:acetyl esterase/lipase